MSNASDSVVPVQDIADRIFHTPERDLFKLTPAQRIAYLEFFGWACELADMRPVSQWTPEGIDAVRFIVRTWCPNEEVTAQLSDIAEQTASALADPLPPGQIKAFIP